ncbi:Arc family DNA-binding protein [Pseudomonas sp. GD03730]|uniref:Arc family DNA-binding protein n=1 Tax=Pseudomonas sp. GD03730 TaxID=2975375 RepID=UPI002449131E|nr:Arc family DNA-binding protein [Pseudomonas sp. GD03730]
MNPIAKDALKRATIARMAVSPDPVAALTPMAQRVQAIQAKSKPAPAPVPAPIEPPPAPVAVAKAKRARKSSREADKFVVRLPDGMRSQITDVSQADERSMNSFVITAVRNELAGRKEQALLLESLALLKAQLEQELATIQAAKAAD